MNRDKAKKMAMSRDCHCVNGKDRDTNFNLVIDKIFDWHEKKILKIKKRILIECVRFCLKDDDSITVEQQVDYYLLSKKNNDLRN